MSVDWTKPIHTDIGYKAEYLCGGGMMANLLADSDVAAMRRSQRAEFRQPFIRNWGIATGARPYRRSAAVGWWALIATVAVCAAVIGAALGIAPTFF